MIRTIIKTVVVASALSLSSITYAWNPYVGAGINVNSQSYNSGVGATIFAGYDANFGSNHNLYMAGELNLDAAHYSESRTTLGAGASILPGISISSTTTLYARLGISAYRYLHYDVKDSLALGVTGIGISTNISKLYNLRLEYTSTDARIGDLYNLSIVYKLPA